ncbi:hypothetical protein [Nocardia blacklockiae]|uniref:hypothetical protein n=1 Tax=Nocardia blacklockiae TaxID=480036 RepID=UPI0018930434|nr:hypothetical protein [Nocardia blacklockiae]MBF6175727.1 hypothetical protein [Nocardia blacklockiae]
MFDPVSLVVGAGLVGVGWACGRLGRRRTGAVRRQLATCGCGHDLAMHDRESGSCHAETFRKTGYGMRAWSACTCRRYTGPTPLEDVFAPPLLPPTN